MYTSSILTQKTFKNLKANNDWSFKEFTSSETNKLTHSYHRYPAKFIPQIVAKLITRYTDEGDVICDPFGGCGTTMLESKLHGRDSIGFDINPVAKFITEVKTTPLSNTSIHNALEVFQKYYNRKQYTIIKEHPRIAYWFDDEVLNELNRIYSAINKITNKSVQKFFLCAFSHNLKTSSRWLTKSIKPTIDKQKIVRPPYKTFISHLNHMTKKNDLLISELTSNVKRQSTTKMFLRDSTKIFPLSPNSVDLIVTSPPYVTSYEYADLHQLTLLWFALDKNNFKNWEKYLNNYHAFRKKFIGTSYRKESYGALNSKLAREIVLKVDNESKALSRGVLHYFLDMEKSFKQMHRVMKKGSNIGLILGNTDKKGVPILNAEVACDQLKLLGFKRKEYIKRKISSKIITPWRDKTTGKFTKKSNISKKQVYPYEYVLVMEKVN